MAEQADPSNGFEGSTSSSSSTHSKVGQGVGRPLTTTHETEANSSSVGDSVNLVSIELARPPDAQGPVNLTFSEPLRPQASTVSLEAQLKSQSTLSAAIPDIVDGFDERNSGQGDQPDGTYEAPTSLRANVTGNGAGSSGSSAEPEEGFDSSSSDFGSMPDGAYVEADSLTSNATITKVELPAAAAAIAQPQSDDPWDVDVSDRLDVQKDALAFARLAASKNVRPPLAIGVFGTWGAGKSFFMRLVHSHIGRLMKGQATAQAPEASSKAFHSKIVQIRFNAWHYVDTNLWASLVEHIFVELSKATKEQPAATEPLESLSTARNLTLEAARELIARKKEQARAAAKYKDASEILETVKLKASTSPSVYVTALSNVFSSTGNADLEKSKADFESAARELGVTTDFKQISGVGTEAEQLVRQGATLAVSTRGAWRFLASGKGFWALTAAVLVVPCALAFGVELATEAKSQLTAINAQIAAWSATAVGLLAIAGRGMNLWRAALEKFEGARQAIDKAVHSRLEPLEKKAAESRAEALAAAEQALIAETTLRAAGERVAAASGEFHGSTGAGRLVKFVQARASDGHYASHQGLVSTVRRDFEELSRGLTSQRPDELLVEQERIERLQFDAEIQKLLTDNDPLLSIEDKSKLTALLVRPSSTARPFERIILYVDDLDRCPADKVVEVLQAVHMLLAFPLFVVFVAVDVRWVAGSLQSQYSTMFASKETDYQRPQTTDYLEKIFQLPYWLPKVSAATGAKLFDGLVPEHRPPAPHPHGSVPEQAPAPAPTSSEVVSVETVDLELDDGERTLLKAYSVYAGQSPRKLIRYVNVYRLLKVGGYLPEFAGIFNYELHALMLQLALVTAFPEHFDEWMMFVRRVESGGRGIQGALSWLETPPEDGMFQHPGFEEALEFFIEQGMPGTPDLHGMSAVVRHGDLVRRFSFAL